MKEKYYNLNTKKCNTLFRAWLSFFFCFILNGMGRIVKTFLHVFLRSFLPTTHYYSKILKTPISFSFKYFFTLLFILNVFFVSYLVVKYNPAKINAVLTAITSSLSKYPDNLVISLKKGYLITNNNRPYFLWLDYQDKKNLFLVIDESASPQKIQSYRSTILLTAKDLVTYDRRTNMFSSFPLLYAEDQRITKEKVNEFVQSANKLSFIFPVIFVIGFLLLLAIIPLSSLLITVIYLILAS